MDFSVGVIIAMGLLVAGVLGLIAMDPGHLPEPVEIPEVLPDPSGSESETAESTVEAVDASGPQTHVVAMAEGSAVAGCEVDNACYTPHTITVNSGDTVLWDNVDEAAHTVNSITDGAPDGMFDSDLVMMNESFEFTFQDSGTYEYFCIVHPWMAGTVVVN